MMLRLLTKAVVIGMTLLFLILGSQFFILEPANATIGQQQEAPGQMLYQSRHSLRDETGTAWQVVLFKRVKNDQIDTINLRLVGFPNQAAFLHPKGLEIMTRQGRLFQAEDQLAKKSPAPNVGEYNLKEILPQLSSTEQVKLHLPLEGQQRTLTLPPPVILEWQELIKQEKR
ncbi:DUF3122 domain-containing protein [Planktothrix agardhii]|jgi:hypothetical protein|uniref:DUF3122 domain-containing protein n=2 Tax=Planktothrix agardhii TaxID=1160 RepID=A0A073CSI6_PLAA1|nr:DUF3122 domain-containing protein [Planktothrix agardhii]MBG0748474.1 DUF3122 domain-containing protein [Planktothrix agardhii KL2]MCB8764051.1 DUF3122 domain-containing protein [Planktothrix agardhii 1809]MCF3590043.1 DUF3122 domain-containing protein [Planktothrix agardhii 1029]MCF3603052.1 DUF3122 domain-containing protein [Planktothrix agardhii 1804]MCF3607147.1 DUF3122 domain-containing protein [Planktothrix agardhii 1033]MCF3624886.1 DUF3122 domain-containing protein [Planktothrix ag